MEKKKDKKYIVKTITDNRTGKRVYFYGKTQREVNKKVLEYSAQSERGRLFTEVSAEWWEEAEPKLAATTINSYKNAKRRADAEFNNIPIKSILPRDVENFLIAVSKKGYAQKTLSHQRLIVNLIFKHAILHNDITYNPCLSVSAPKGLPKEKRTAASSEDEIKILNAADEWIFPYIALMTGMRKGEILALRWEDIDFINNIITVNKQIYYLTNNPTIIYSTKTESGMRSVPLLDDLKERLLKTKPSTSSGCIITDDGKNPITKKRYEILYRNFKKKTGITCTAHQLRHSFATKAFECGVPVKSVQNILGHSQISTTMDIYTDFREKALKEAAVKLNKKA